MAYRKARKAKYRARKAVEHAQVLVAEPSMEQLVRRMAARGATDEDFEAMYGLTAGTVARWKKAYKGFAKAIEEGRTRADGDVLFAMYRNCVGYDYYEEQAVGGRSPSVLKVRRYKPGETTAQKHWLASRQREYWPAREQLDHAGVPGQPIGLKVETRNELIDSIVALIASKPDGKTKPEKQGTER